MQKRVPAEEFVKWSSPTLKRLLQWLICTLSFTDFKDLQGEELLITSAANKEASAWASVLINADTKIKPSPSVKKD